MFMSCDSNPMYHASRNQFESLGAHRRPGAIELVQYASSKKVTRAASLRAIPMLLLVMKASLVALD